jgi:hypothetical protein
LPEEDGSYEDDDVDNLAALRSQATSPLAGRGKTLAKDIRVTEKVDRTSSPLDAQDGEEGSDETEDDGSDIAKTESDDWLPASSRPWSTTAIPQNGPLPHLQQAPSPVFEKDVKAGHAKVRRSNKTSVSELAHDLGELNLTSKKTHQPAARPTRTRQSKAVSETEEDGDEDPIIVVQNAKGGEGQKKKKR